MSASWECREHETDPALSWVERGTGEACERFIDTPLPYSEACKIEALLSGPLPTRASCTPFASCGRSDCKCGKA